MIRHELGIAYAYLTYFEIFIIISNISMGLFEILQITQGPCIYAITGRKSLGFPFESNYVNLV